MNEYDSELYNLVNIHTPTANLGSSIVCGLVLTLGLYKLYNYFIRMETCRPGRARRGGDRPCKLPQWT